jgi:hypothetical protein
MDLGKKVEPAAKPAQPPKLRPHPTDKRFLVDEHGRLSTNIPTPPTPPWPFPTGKP